MSPNNRYQQSDLNNAGFLPSQTHPMGNQPLLPESSCPQTFIPASHAPSRVFNRYDALFPADLFAVLKEEPSKPPPEDMNPTNPEMTPYEQNIRFEGDLYEPTLVRGRGNNREGWCGRCKPGRWIALKNTQYWADKAFTHGICPATGQPFQEPTHTRRMDGKCDILEAQCGTCNKWIALVNRKTPRTSWFRHAWKVRTLMQAQ